MATNVIMPALGISQDTGRVVSWLKAEGQSVTQGEPLLEIETDKAVVELEAPASGILANVSAQEGDEVPVAQVIALILAPGESAPPPAAEPAPPPAAEPAPPTAAPAAGVGETPAPTRATPVATRIAQEHGVDLRQVKSDDNRIEKADVLAYIESQKAAPVPSPAGRIGASPKARRLAAERGIDLALLRGSGPGGMIQAADVPASSAPSAPAVPAPPPVSAAAETEIAVSTVWRIMAERITQSWTSVPHFYLLRDVNAGGLIAWREQAQKSAEIKITYTDLLVKVLAAALRRHSRLNAMWAEGKIRLNEDVNVGLAMAIEDGLVVPVIHGADRLSVSEIAARRQDLVARAQAGKLRPDDIAGGTFTLSNLGMYGVDVFNAIVNPPQAAILAVGRIVERVVPLNGQPVVRPMMTLSLSCDHRVVDGARGAQFLDAIAGWIQEPLGLL